MRFIFPTANQMGDELRLKDMESNMLIIDTSALVGSPSL